MKNNMEYFVGKICSIFTTPTNRDFSLEGPNYLQQFLNYFLGKVEAVDTEGILLSHQNGLKIYVMKSQLVAIAEEETLDPNNPQDAKVINEIKPMPIIKNPPKSVSVTELPLPSKEVAEVKIPNFSNIESISTLASKLKENFGKKSK
jgi:hypothetical protein